MTYHATRKVYDLGRRQDERPWMLTVSFSHPHDPYVARRKYWDLYEDCAHLDPEVPAFDLVDQDPHSRRLLEASDAGSFDITPDNIRRSRRAYFANISYVDNKIGEVLSALEATGQVDNTIILFLSDHGDMLGERGLWFKMSFLEGSARVPLMIAGPGLPSGRIETPVSTMDVNPTLADLAGIDLGDILPWTDGETLVPLAHGEARTAPVLMEYAAEGSEAPLVAIRQGQWKYIHCELDPPQLFDLEADPHELRNLADDPAHAAQVERFAAMVRETWDIAAFDAAVRESQARRLIVYEALRNGAYFPWDFQPLQRASERFMRNHMDLNVLEHNQRYPRGE